ncbi:hypothetical protein DPQ25_09945 [Hydrogeniiclostridium mannosilyticum]|uniref:Uncharacterized protein n=1 Tax=Hydrogeniiclostridium mannosilyticum TaxID=2764322 RepID=A0A328UAM4_9FIRM|nr:hypothetical protein DPQ25_09945 [Hydrogeniiclostridium mannosilyticum]
MAKQAKSSAPSRLRAVRTRLLCCHYSTLCEKEEEKTGGFGPFCLTVPAGLRQKARLCAAGTDGNACKSSFFAL